MIDKKSDSGVSSVVGVILMVAITVILGTVIGQFVLGLSSNVQQSAQASITTSQNYDFDNSTYVVTIRVTGMQNADFLQVTTPEILKQEGIGDDGFSGPSDGRAGSPTFYADGGSSGTPITDPYIRSSGVTENSTNVPDTAEASDVGDVVKLGEMEPGTTIQIIGNLDGNENVISTYEVKDTRA
jgi:flagellin-like protein